jgi:regulator of Ty1 transposition protein 103
MSFSESSLSKKLNELNNTQQSVQTLSLWLIHHRKFAKNIVALWLRELKSQTNCEKKLTLIYLANDILQNSRKKGNEYLNEFDKALNEAFENTTKYSDNKILFTLERILNIWKDRKIYSEKRLDDLKAIIHTTTSISDLQSPPLDDVSKADSEEAKTNSLQRKENTVPDKISNNVPDTQTFLQLLRELENAPSCDAIAREKIANLPSSIKDVNIVKTLKSKSDIAQFTNTINEAIQLLDGYNNRLKQELKDRKTISSKLVDYTEFQMKESENDEKLLREWEERYTNALQLKNELRVHLESLPDLDSIEKVAEITPLPSAGDLFSSNKNN